MNEKKVYILRGISGSGKSTFAKEALQHLNAEYITAVVCSADHYMVDADGRYRYDASKLAQNYERCRGAFLDCIAHQTPRIFVDNTHTRVWEFENTIKIAEMFGYEVNVLRFTTPVRIAAQRTVHAVPFEVLEKMNASFQPYDGEKTIPSIWQVKHVPLFL